MTEPSDESAQFNAMIRALVANAESRSKFAQGFCENPLRRRFLAATFRCRQRRCVLAFIYNTGDHVIVDQPGYKLSRSENAERSNESGRRKNTYDGERKWKRQTFILQEDNYHQLNCDHVNAEVVSAQEILTAAQARRDRVW